MTPEKVLEDVCQLRGNRSGVERQDPLDNMVCTRLVSWIEVARLSGGLERPYHDARRIGPQVQSLPVEKRFF